MLTAGIEFPPPPAPPLPAPPHPCRNVMRIKSDASTVFPGISASFRESEMRFSCSNDSTFAKSRVNLLSFFRASATCTHGEFQYCSLLPNSRVRHRVKQIRQEIHQHIRESDGQNAALYEIVVAVAYRLNGEPANSRPGEN